MTEKIKLGVDVPSGYQPGHLHRAGTPAVVVERLGPNIYLVEVRVSDPTLEGDAWYETLELREDEVQPDAPSDGPRQDRSDS